MLTSFPDRPSSICIDRTPVWAWALMVLGVVFGGSVWGQSLVEWELTSNGTPTYTAPNISAGTFTGNGTGTVTFNANGAYSNGWPTSGLNTGTYYEISASPNSGYSLNITTLEFDERRSGTGIRDYQVQYSLNGFSNSTTIATVNVPDNTGSRSGNITGLNIDVLDGQTITFRFYGYNAEASTGTWRINDGTLKIIGNITPVSTNTNVEFASATYTAAENGGSTTVCANITNPGNATTVEVALTSGAAANLGYYTTQILTFPAGSSAQECITVTPTDNSTCDGDAAYTFTLQNISGGNAASIGTQNTSTLTVTDDEASAVTLAYQGFEGSGWNYVPNPTTYNVSNDIWAVVDEINNHAIDPATGLYFWGMRDLDNPNGGGNFDHELEFDNLSVAGYSSVQVSFDYHTVGFDTGDFLQYQIAYDGGTYGPVQNLAPNTTSWVTETIAAPNGTNAVRLKLIANQDGANDYAGFDNVTVSGIGCSTCTEPTAQAAFYVNSPFFLTETDATLQWTNGNGGNRLVVLREGSAVATDPVDGTTYSGNPAFGTGTDIGINEYAVYNGPGGSVPVTNLTPGTEYFAKIFEYNCLPGNEDYLTTGSPDTDVFITPPERPVSLDEGCVGEGTFDLSWAPPVTGNFDGYLLVARQGATPHAVTTLDPATQAFNPDYSVAPTYGAPAPASRVLYRGTSTSATITGLTYGTDYTFLIFAYTIGTSGHQYSTGTQTSENISLHEVDNLAATPSATSVELTWTVDASCTDEIIVAASNAGAVTSFPSGSGYSISSNSFTDIANPTLSPGGEVVVYSNSGANLTVTNLVTDQEYCFKVFVRKGSTWTPGVELCETPRTTTVLEPGDLSVVAVNTKIHEIGGNGDDELCFIAYKSITANTAIDFTDNGYERVNAGEWGNTEGAIRIQRSPTAVTIPAGQVICVRGSGYNPGNFTVYTCGVADPDWTVIALNGNYNFDLNGEDQVWIMQAGTWNPGTPLNHDATYSGNVLYGWTATGWQSIPNWPTPPIGTKGSTQYPNTGCFQTDLNTISDGDKVKYTGPMTSATRIQWILRINDVTNWTGYVDSLAYYDTLTAPRYNDACIVFDINPTVATAGEWTGATDSDWFDCTNWDNLIVPDQTVNVTVPNVTNDPDIDQAGGECRDLNIEPSASVDLSPGGELSIYGDVVRDGTFVPGKGVVAFRGGGSQWITNTGNSVGGLCAFDTLVIDKPTGRLYSLDNLSINTELNLTQGLIVLNDPSLRVEFANGSTASNTSNASFVAGRVRKTGTGGPFTFPIGDTTATGEQWYQPARIFDFTGANNTDAQYFAEPNPHAGAYYDGQPQDNRDIGNCDYWKVDKLSGVDVRIAFKFTNPDPDYCNNVTDANFLSLARWNGAAWDDPPNVSQGTDPTSFPGEIAIGAIGPTSVYGQFALSSLHSDLNVLPITLLHFEATARDNTVLTEWTTASEANNDYFTVERSADGVHFVPIATVDGAGTSTEARHYSFADDAPLPLVSYYRLRQTDFDGAYTTSPVRAVAFGGLGAFGIESVYRGPEGLNLRFRSTAPYTVVEIFDPLGKRVFGEVIESTEGPTTLHPDLARGIYMLRISHGGQSDVRRFFY